MIFFPDAEICSNCSPSRDSKRTENGYTTIISTPTVTDLGTTLDSHLDLGKHINNICKSASFAIKNIGRIRRYLSQSDCERIIHAFITSKLDYCNAILYGLPQIQLDKLQRVQNTAARIVSKTKKSEPITPILRSLHWLPIQKRIIFKLLLITYKALNGQAPIYISELLTNYKPSRNLRSSAKNLLIVPRSNTKTYGDRSFQVAAAKLFNELPTDLKSAVSTNSFKAKLKTYLFNL